MRYTLVIQASPFTGTAASHALETAKELLGEAGKSHEQHSIDRLFFYQDGVFNACSRLVTPQNLPDLPSAWQTLVRKHDLDAVVCVSSALQRGVLDAGEAARYEKGQDSMLEGFTLGGLGLLVEALSESDRILVFG